MKTCSTVRHLALALLSSLPLAASAAPPPGYSLSFTEEFDAPLSFFTGPGSTGTWKTWYYSGLGPEGNDRIGDLEWCFDANYTGELGGTNPLGIDPFIVDGGVLSIETDLTPPAIKPQISNYNYTSGVITTQRSFWQTYGYFEIRCKLPATVGFLPAFWLLPTDMSHPPEIDIMEVASIEPDRLHVNTHAGAANPGGFNGSRIVDDTSADYHVYGLEWTADKITWYYDGLEVASGPTPANMHKDMYMIANLAVRGFPGNGPVSGVTEFPSYYDIDYIRAYARTDSPDPDRIEVIKDNADTTGFSASSGWTIHTTGNEKYGGSYLLDGGTGQGTKSVRWTPTIPVTGVYDIYLKYTSWSNRASNTPVEITHAGGVSTVYVNQKKFGGFWYPVGTGYTFNAGTAGYVRVTNTGADGVVSADAVRFVKRPTEVIVDNSAATLTGSWTSSTYSPGYYGTNYIHDGNTGKGLKSVQFRPSLPVAGDYTVYARWISGTDRATNVPIDVVSTAGSQTITVNMKNNSASWYSLGTYNFAAGSNGYVLLRNAGTNGTVTADAVRFVAP